MDADKAIYESFRAWAGVNTPPGTRLVFMLDGLLSIEVCCNGQVPITALMCTLSPGHKDDCWSQHKKVDFMPEVGGPIDYLVAKASTASTPLPEIEDYEYEKGGAYIRVSINPDGVAEQEVETVRKVLDALGLMED